MAKNFKKMLAMMLAVAMVFTMFTLPALAASVDGPYTSEPVTNEDGSVTTTTTTTTTEDPAEDGSVTVIVEVVAVTTGIDAETGYPYTKTVKTITTTVTDAEGNTTQTITVEEGHQVIEGEGEPSADTELPEIDLNIPTDGTVVSGSGHSENNPDPSGDVAEGEDDSEYDYTDTESTIDREASASAGESGEVTDVGSTDLDPVGPDIDPNENSDGDMIYSQLENPEELFGPGNEIIINWESAPEGYDYVISGFGEMVVQENDEVIQSGYTEESGKKALIAIKVKRDEIVFLRDEETGELLKDAEGNYIATYVRDDNGYAQGNKIDNNPTIFALKKKDGAEGEFYFAYCIDADTETVDGVFYKLANLEDSDYYATDDAAARLRAIVSNGYWGTNATEGDYTVENPQKGSLQSIINAVKAYYKPGDTIKVPTSVTRAEDEHDPYITNYEDMTYDELIALLDGLTEAEALAATQAAIWMLSNGNANELTGEDGRHIQYPTYTYKNWNTSTKRGSWHEYIESTGNNQYNDGKEGTARMIAVMNWLLSLEGMKATDVVINEKNFIDSFGITIKDKVEDNLNNADVDQTNDVYEVDLSFTVAFVPDDDDNLLVYLYHADGSPMLDKNGDQIVKRLASPDGKAAVTDDDIELIEYVDGAYTLTGLELQEGKFDFQLKISGTQILDKDVYIYTAAESSQTLVGMASGTQDVDVYNTFSLNFTVDEKEHVVAEHHWRTENDPIVEGDDDDDDIIPGDDDDDDDIIPGDDDDDDDIIPGDDDDDDIIPGDDDDDDIIPGDDDDDDVIPGDDDDDTTEIADEDTPAAEVQDEVVDIPDEETPLVEIPDEVPPLAEVPKTGDASLVWAVVSLMSGTGLFGLAFAGKKKDEE